jgi:hypothetical protein
MDASDLQPRVISANEYVVVLFARALVARQAIPTCIPTTGWNTRHRRDLVDANVHVSALHCDA